ncbi:MAG: ABC transporter permease [Acidimicrobiia bacterium]|nr:ABC transporter permease [Acidimicrobiia bacterium]
MTSVPVVPAHTSKAGSVLRSRPLKLVAGSAAAVLVWFAADRLLPDGAPLGIVAIGAVLGSVTSLLAMGLILIWRSNHVVNFAYGSMGGVAGVLSVHLFLDSGWNWWLAIGLACLTGAVVGGLVEVLVIRRFSRSSRLILTVATIGLAQLLGGIELIIPRFFGNTGLVVGGFETPLQGFKITLDPVLVTGDHMLIVAVVPLVVAGLAWFLLRTSAGIAVRAAAENSDRALLLGIPIRRLVTLVWIVAGALSALTFVLRAPFQGVTPGVIAGPAILLPAFAAAVIARMESLPVAFVAGCALGVLEQVVLWNSDKASAADVAFLVVILVALLAQRGRRSRAEESGASSWSESGLVSRIPRVLRRLPEVVTAQVLLVLLLVGGAVLLPLAFGPSVQNLLSVWLVWGIVAVSLVVLTGWGGNISLGQFAIVGTGAICAGNLMVRFDVDFFLALAAAGVTGAVVALLVGLPALRIQGPFLAVTTLAFAVTLDSFVLNPNNFPDLVPQEIVRPVLWERFPLEVERNAYWLCLAFLVLAIVVAVGVRRTRSGRLLLAARDNRRMAEALGVPSTWTRLSAFLLSGTIAGVAGGLHVMLLHGARMGSYRPTQSIEVFTQSVIGGIGSVTGSLMGVFGAKSLEQVAGEFRLLITGVGLLVVLLVLPGGLVRVLARVRDALLRRVAARRGLVVPSLLGASAATDIDVRAGHDAHAVPHDDTRLLAGALSEPAGERQDS